MQSSGSDEALGTVHDARQQVHGSVLGAGPSNLAAAVEGPPPLPPLPHKREARSHSLHAFILLSQPASALQSQGYTLLEQWPAADHSQERRFLGPIGNPDGARLNPTSGLGTGSPRPESVEGHPGCYLGKEYNNRCCETQDPHTFRLPAKAAGCRQHRCTEPTKWYALLTEAAALELLQSEAAAASAAMSAAAASTGTAAAVAASAAAQVAARARFEKLFERVQFGYTAQQIEEAVREAEEQGKDAVRERAAKDRTNQRYRGPQEDLAGVTLYRRKDGVALFVDDVAGPYDTKRKRPAPGNQPQGASKRRVLSQELPQDALPGSPPPRTLSAPLLPASPRSRSVSHSPQQASQQQVAQAAAEAAQLVDPLYAAAQQAGLSLHSHHQAGQFGGQLQAALPPGGGDLAQILAEALSTVLVHPPGPPQPLTLLPTINENQQAGALSPAQLPLSQPAQSSHQTATAATVSLPHFPLAQPAQSYSMLRPVADLLITHSPPPGNIHEAISPVFADVDADLGGPSYTALLKDACDIQQQPADLCTNTLVLMTGGMPGPRPAGSQMVSHSGVTASETAAQGALEAICVDDTGLPSAPQDPAQQPASHPRPTPVTQASDTMTQPPLLPVAAPIPTVDTHTMIQIITSDGLRVFDDYLQYVYRVNCSDRNRAREMLVQLQLGDRFHRSLAQLLLTPTQRLRRDVDYYEPDKEEWKEDGSCQCGMLARMCETWGPDLLTLVFNGMSNNTSVSTALHTAARHRKMRSHGLRMLQLVLQYAGVHALLQPTQAFYTPLQVAARNGDTEAADLILHRLLGFLVSCRLKPQDAQVALYALDGFFERAGGDKVLREVAEPWGLRVLPSDGKKGRVHAAQVGVLCERLMSCFQGSQPVEPVDLRTPSTLEEWDAYLRQD